MNVVGAPVTVETFVQSLQLVGSFEAPEEVMVVSKLQGGVERIPVEEGQKVKRGDLLAKLDDDKIQARLQEASARLALAKSSLDRALNLRKTNSISDQEYDEAVAEVDRAEADLLYLQEELEDTEVTAPMDGVLGEILVSKGQIVPLGQHLMDLVQTDPLEIRFEVPEIHLDVLRKGLRVDITTDAYKEEVFSGEVTFLAPRLRESTRTLPVKATVPNPDGRLKPAMFGDVALVLREIPDAMSIPEAAVMHQGDQTTVVVQNAEGRAEFRPVQVEARQAGRMVIREGIDPEDKVVVEGWMKVRPNTLLNFTEDSRRYGLEPSSSSQARPEREAAAEDL